MKQSVKKINSNSEIDFLNAQADQAKQRFFNSAETIASQLLGKVNVVKWTRQHPFQSTSIAAGVGFVVAQSIPSSREAKQDTEPKSAEKVKKSSALSALLLPVIYEAATDILKNSLLPFIQGVMSSSQDAPVEEEEAPPQNWNANP